MKFMQLSPILVAPLFALIGILVTITAQHLALRRQISGDRWKSRFGILLAFAGELEKRRLDAYSEIGLILSDAVKRIDFPDMSDDSLDLPHLESTLSALDSKYSILFSSLCGENAMKLRVTLRRIIRRTGVGVGFRSLSPAEVAELRDALIGLEVALRIDLGVYAVEFAEIERGYKQYTGTSKAENFSA